MAYKEFSITAAPTQLQNGQWKLEGAITPIQGGVGNMFESQNSYPSSEAAEKHFINFAKRYIDGTASRSDIDQG